MKKLLTVFALIGLFAVGNMSYVKAQEPAQSDTATDVAVEEEAQSFTDEVVEDEPAASTADTSAEIVTTRTFHQQIKDTFIEGGPFFMSFILICLILGLALSIERIIYLNMASINKNKFLEGVEEALSTGGVEAAKDYCRNTRGPIASIFYQGLERYEEGIDMVEKSVVAYGGVQMGQLEKGRWW